MANLTLNCWGVGAGGRKQDFFYFFIFFLFFIKQDREGAYSLLSLVNSTGKSQDIRLNLLALLLLLPRRSTSSVVRPLLCLE